MGEREREERVRFRFTIQFAAPRNLIKRFYVYYGQFYMCVYPRHIRFARHRPTSRPSIIHKFHPLLGFLAFPLLQIPLPLSNEPRKKEKKKKSLQRRNDGFPLFFSFIFFYERLLVSGILVSPSKILRGRHTLASRMFAFRRFTTG